MILAIYIAAALAAIFNLGAELRRCLMMFQQNSYRTERYAHWLKESGDSTSGWRLCGMIVFFFALTPMCPPLPAVILAGIFSIFCGVTLVKRKYKKPLVMTMRTPHLRYSIFPGRDHCRCGYAAVRPFYLCQWIVCGCGGAAVLLLPLALPYHVRQLVAHSR